MVVDSSVTHPSDDFRESSDSEAKKRKLADTEKDAFFAEILMMLGDTSISEARPKTYRLPDFGIQKKRKIKKPSKVSKKFGSNHATRNPHACLEHRRKHEKCPMNCPGRLLLMSMDEEPLQQNMRRREELAIPRIQKTELSLHPELRSSSEEEDERYSFDSTTEPTPKDALFYFPLSSASWSTKVPSTVNSMDLHSSSALTSLPSGLPPKKRGKEEHFLHNPM
jgi:hypothetical protein